MTEVDSFFDQYAKTVFEKDLEGFLALFDEKVYVFDMWGTWLYEGLAAWRSMVADWFGSLGAERVAVTFDDRRITTAGDMALATAFVTFTALSAEGEKLRSLQNRLSWTLQKKNGQWKIIHEHTSAPIQHDTGRAVLRRPEQKEPCRCE